MDRTMKGGKVKSICVSCGSNRGSVPEYVESARKLGKTMAGRGLTLVYGGARVGLMGEIADAVLGGKGRAVGVLPRFLGAEVGHASLTELHEVDTMHERKTRMFELSDAYIALPGGFGTLEEMMEVLTWAQLGLHRKPIGFLNVRGYFDDLMRFADHAVSQRFLKAEHRAMMLSGGDPEKLIDQLSVYEPPEVGKWIGGKDAP
jgi:uncharacterized protein (TIGR00730 family)